MQHLSDAQLLQDYAAHHSEAAFCAIVARYTDLVYSSALRQTASPDLAREITQSVFTDLARKADGVARESAENTSLVGWFYRSTRLAVLKTWRDEQRRQAHQRLVMENLDRDAETAGNWDGVAPALDEAMAALGDADREAVLLRYFQNQDFHAVGRALGVSDDAAQKRVSRAVDRLRDFLAKRGVTVGTGGLIGVLSAHAVQAAPAGLPLAASTAALSAAALAPLTSTLVVMKLSTAKIVAASAVIVMLLGAGSYFLWRQIIASMANPSTATATTATTLLGATNEILYQEMLRAAPVAGEVLESHPTRIYWTERREILFAAGYIERREIPLPKVLPRGGGANKFFADFHGRFYGVDVALRSPNRESPPIASVTARKFDFGPTGAIEQFIRNYNPEPQVQ